MRISNIVRLIEDKTVAVASKATTSAKALSARANVELAVRITHLQIKSIERQQELNDIREVIAMRDAIEQQMRNSYEATHAEV